MVWAIVGGAIVLVVAAGGFFILRGRKSAAEEEVSIKVSERGCSEGDRKRIREEYEKFLEEVIIYRQKLLELAEKNPRLRSSEAFRNLERIWTVAEDMKGEIEFYPSDDCLKHFREKFEFYRKLIRENLERLNKGG
jgi:hypothetical protein